MKYHNYLKQENPTVIIDIAGFGTIQLELFYDVAPNTVANFIALIVRKFFDGLSFHRIIPGFMIQGGQGEKPACPIKGEFEINGFNNPLNHTRGVISMARTNEPNSQSSQFFIMHATNQHLDGSYAAFGGVIKGMDVVDKIALVPTDKNDKPLKDVIIKAMTVHKHGEVYPAAACYTKS